MGNLYRGNKFVGEVEGGSVYSGHGLHRKLVGTIENGTVYSGHGLGRETVGSFEGDTIYSGHGLGRDIAGAFENGTVYAGYGFGRHSIGTANSVADAAALLLLPLPTVDEYYAPQTESQPAFSPSAVGGLASISEGGCLVALLGIILFLMFVFGALLFWPVLFSKQVLSDPDTPVYLPVTLVSIAIGILAAVRFLKKRTFKPMLAVSTTVATVLLSIAIFVLDPSFKLTDIAFLAVFALVACALPSFILSRIFRKKNRKKRR